MKEIFGLLQTKGYDIGCPPSDDVPTNEMFDEINTRYMNHVKECSVTFPVIHYFIHHQNLQNHVLNTLATTNCIGIVLRCLLLDKRRRYDWCISVTKERPSTLQQAFLQYIEDMRMSLLDEIPQDEITAELIHLWQAVQWKDNELPSQTIIAPKLELFHPEEEVKNFRTMVRGRAWFPPGFYSTLFIVWNMPNDFPWTIVPHTLINHKKPNVLDLLCSNAPPVSAYVWNKLCSNLNIDTLVGAQTFSQHIFGNTHPHANAMYLTRSIPNWRECWTRQGWPMRRSIVRKLQTWREPVRTVDLITMVEALYSL